MELSMRAILVLALHAFATFNFIDVSAQATDLARHEQMLRESMPSDVRCGSGPERSLVYCR